MKIDIIKIGNSRGVRLPKAVLEQCGIENEAVLDVRDGEIVLRPIKRRPREGWREAFAAAAKSQDEQELLLGEFANEFDDTDWTWPDTATKGTGKK